MTTRSTGAGPDAARALGVDRRRHQPCRARRDQHVGRGGRLLLRRAAASGRQSGPLKVRSLVGLMPLVAATVIDAGARTEFPELVQGAAEFLSRHPAVTAALPGHGRQATARDRAGAVRAVRREPAAPDPGPDARRGGVPRTARHPLGVAVARQHPFVIAVDGQAYSVDYLPAESDTGMFGGNSNWRGPVWFPINVMLIRALLNLYVYFGDEFTVECPTGSGHQLNLNEVAREISDRLTGTFLAGGDGRRPVHGGQPILQDDPHWRDLLLFYEYFHGDNGAGIGASHQTGWTGTVALLPLLFRGTPSSGWPSGADRGPRPSGSPRPRAGGLPQAAARRRRPRHDRVAGAAGDLRGQHRGLADRPVPGRRAAADPGRRGRGRLGRRHPGRRRRRLADGRLGAEPGRAGPRERERRNCRRRSATRCPTCEPADVIGSPYCVRRYVVDAAFGGPRRAGRGPGRAGRPRRAAGPGLRAQPCRPGPPLGDERARSCSSRAPRTTCGRIRPAGWRRAARCSPTAATRTSRRGPMSCSSTRSRRRCARRRPTRWPTSPPSATGSAATWPC